MYRRLMRKCVQQEYRIFGPMQSDVLESVFSHTEVLHLCSEELYLSGLTLDTGAAANVVGQNWVDSYKKTLSPKMLTKWTVNRKPARFRFGDTAAISVEYQQRIPIKCKNRVLYYEAHIVPGDCPALVGLPALRRMGADIRCGTDEIVIPDVLTAPVVFTKRNHYVLRFCDLDGACSKVVFHVSHAPQNMSSASVVENSPAKATEHVHGAPGEAAPVVAETKVENMSSPVADDACSTAVSSTDAPSTEVLLTNEHVDIRPLDGLNTNFRECNLSIMPNGKELYFMSTRRKPFNTSFGDGDIYKALYIDSAWIAPDFDKK